MSDGAKAKKPRWLGFLRGPAFSPHGLLTRAVIITLAYLVAHCAGLREYTTIISGTSPTGVPNQAFPALLGILYVLLYMGFVVVVPILIIAALFFAGWAGLTASPAGPDAAAPAPDEAEKNKGA